MLKTWYFSSSAFWSAGQWWATAPPPPPRPPWLRYWSCRNCILKKIDCILKNNGSWFIEDKNFPKKISLTFSNFSLTFSLNFLTFPDSPWLSLTISKKICFPLIFPDRINPVRACRYQCVSRPTKLITYWLIDSMFILLSRESDGAPTCRMNPHPLRSFG